MPSLDYDARNLRESGCIDPLNLLSRLTFSSPKETESLSKEVYNVSNEHCFLFLVWFSRVCCVYIARPAQNVVRPHSPPDAWTPLRVDPPIDRNHLTRDNLNKHRKIASVRPVGPLL